MGIMNDDDDDNDDDVSSAAGEVEKCPSSVCQSQIGSYTFADTDELYKLRGAGMDPSARMSMGCSCQHEQKHAAVTAYETFFHRQRHCHSLLGLPSSYLVGVSWMRGLRPRPRRPLDFNRVRLLLLLPSPVF